jgi:Rrf2 family transcriptional regulator, nitric oxide-sensitive transcriptional repressor
MNRLNRKVEYALMALKVMAQKRAGELTSAKEVVEKTGCPFDATARVLQQMAQKGIL